MYKFGRKSRIAGLAVFTFALVVASIFFAALQGPARAERQDDGPEGLAPDAASGIIDNIDWVAWYSDALTQADYGDASEIPTLPPLKLPVPRDLSVSSSDIVLPSTEPVEYDTFNIQATIHDKNRFPTPNVLVCFYDNTTKIAEYTEKFLYNATLVVSKDVQVSGAGEHTIRVVVDPNNSTNEKDKTNNAASVKLNVKMKKTFDLLLIAKLSNATVEPGGSARFPLLVMNKGNTEDTIAFVSDPMDANYTQRGWGVSVSPSSITVQAGTNGTINVTINAPSSATEQDVFKVRVIATSAGAPAKNSSAILTLEISPASQGGEEEGGLLPGMESFAALAAIGVAALLCRKKDIV